MLACSRAAGLHDEAVHNQDGLDCVRPRVDTASDQKEDLSTAGPGQNNTPGIGFRARNEASQAAQVSVRDRYATSGVCRTDTATGDNRRDPECLDAYEYWSPVSEGGGGEPSDASVGVDLTFSHELEAFRPRPARWTHRADLYPLGRREDEV
ncbi:unnamed protein product [Phytophthora fragariaefolia]|uniref:Unnamed protein product n=1 Tax=Phytophthora fragariaefolia TaxID=1490495 RepID=A0A9W6WV47_9STRA|nr:unnamed protein product [Phytophthora fragariaefolia]